MSRYIAAEHPDLGLLYAAVDPDVRFLAPRIEQTRFAAFLAPFKTEDAAKVALMSAGGKLVTPPAKAKR